MATLTIYVDDAGEHRWRCRTANGETVASGEGHTSARDARRAAAGAAMALVDALVEDRVHYADGALPGGHARRPVAPTCDADGSGPDA